MQRKIKSKKPFSLEDLVKYNERVLFPALEARFVTKDEFNEFKKEMYEFKKEMVGFKDEMYTFKEEMTEFKQEMHGFKEEMYEFKNEMHGFKEEFQSFKDQAMTYFDDILKKLDILIEEKAVSDYQWEKAKQLLMFLVKKMKDHDILSEKDLAMIKSMEVF